MRLIIIGSEYTGKTTLTQHIRQWLVQTTGACTTSFHDHFVLPYVEGAGPEAEEEARHLLALTPFLQECFSRYMIHYHMADSFYQAPDHCVVNWYYGDAVYAPLYYRYGGVGQYSDRQVMARAFDAHVMEVAPDTVLVHMTAAPETIRRRMREHPQPLGPLQDKDVEVVLARFEEQFNQSLIPRRFSLDTTDASAADTFQAFLGQIERHLSQRDQLRILTHQALGR